MTPDQIVFRHAMMQAIESNGGDVFRACIWMQYHMNSFGTNQKRVIIHLHPKERNAVLHELTMKEVD